MTHELKKKHLALRKKPGYRTLSYFWGSPWSDKLQVVANGGEQITEGRAKVPCDYLAVEQDCTNDTYTATGCAGH